MDDEDDKDLPWYGNRSDLAIIVMAAFFFAFTIYLVVGTNPFAPLNDKHSAAHAPAKPASEVSVGVTPDKPK